MYEYVVANGGKFTVSITLASSDLTKTLGTFLFRSFVNKTVTLKTYEDGTETQVTVNNANSDTGNSQPLFVRDTNKVPFLNTSASNLWGPYNYFGGKATESGSTVKIPITAVDEFVTVDIVVDLFAPCKMIYHNTTGKCYTCGDDGKITVNGVDYRCNICYTGEKMDATKHCQTCNLTGTVPTFYYYVNGECVNVAPANQSYAGGVCPSVSAEYFNANLTFYNICAGSAGKLRSVVVSPFDIVNTK